MLNLERLKFCDKADVADPIRDSATIANFFIIIICLVLLNGHPSHIAWPVLGGVRHVAE